MASFKVEGSVVAVVTPMNEDTSVDYESLARLIEFHISHGTDGILVLGTTGETPTLTAAEELEIAKFAVEKVAGRVPVILGAGSNATKEALDKVHDYNAVGVDALLVITPYYNRTSDAGMLAHFTAIAEASEKPIILYNVPSRTGCSISIPVLKELAQHPKIVGIKEASGNVAYATQVAQLVSEDFVMYCATDDLNLPLLSVGAVGLISVWANVEPQKAHDLVAAYQAGDVARARAIHLEALDLIKALFSENNPIPVKAAMKEMGLLTSGKMRLPLVDMTAGKFETLKAELEKRGL